MHCKIFRQINWNSSLENITFGNANAEEVVLFFFFFNFFYFIYRTITYTTYSTNILLTCIHYLQYINYNAITLISLFTMQFSIIEKLHVYIQVTNLLQLF